MYPHTQNKDQVALATCSLLTGSCSGGAFPKGVFEGDFGQILSHFLSFFYNTKEKKKWTQNGLGNSQRRSRRDTFEKLLQVRFGFVHGRFPIFVTDAHLRPVVHKVLPGGREAKTLRQGEQLNELKFKTTGVGVGGGGRTNLCHQVLSPEAGVMQWRVAVFVGCVGVRFALNQLQKRQKIK